VFSNAIPLLVFIPFPLSGIDGVRNHPRDIILEKFEAIRALSKNKYERIASWKVELRDVFLRPFLPAQNRVSK
jgi:hypothetical protein